MRANSSFESASDPRLHFGLGAATRVDSMVVRWPSGTVETLGAEAADQELARLTYHASCHTLRGQGVTHQPLDLLCRVRDAGLV